MPFADGRPSGQPTDILTGFLNEDGEAFGRPVGIAITDLGALLVADDVGNVIWRVTTARDATQTPTGTRPSCREQKSMRPVSVSCAVVSSSTSDKRNSLTS